MKSTVSTFVGKGVARPGEPVVILLHGYGADERDLPEIMKFLPDLPWVSPRAPEPSQYGSFAWFGITTPLDPSLVEVSEATAKIWDWIDSNLPQDSPLVVVGFSQGGLMATQLLRTRPQRIMATVILAGFVYAGELEGDAFLKATKPKVIYCRGLDDSVISREAVGRLNLWLQQHTKAITRTYEGLAHSIDQRVLADVSDYLRQRLTKENQR